MHRRTVVGVFAVAVLALGGGVAFWLAYSPRQQTRLEQTQAPGGQNQQALQARLLGSWEGTGTFSGPGSFEITPAPGQGVSGGKSEWTATITADVHAQFNPDGTYRWSEHSQGPGFRITIVLPQDDKQPSLWEVVRTQGNELTVRLHNGEVLLVFEEENAFTMNLPGSAGTSGAYHFRRAVMPK